MQGGQSATPDSKKLSKIGKKSGRIGENKRKNREGSFTLPLLTDRAGYATEAKPELDVHIDTRRLNFHPTTTYLGVKFDRTLSYRQHLAGLRDKVMARSALIRKLVGTGWGASPSTLRTSALALVYAPAEYCAPTWSRSRHTSPLDVSLLHPTYNHWMLTTDTSRAVEQLPVLAGIPSVELSRRAASLALARRAMDPDHLLHHTITREETQPRLTSLCHKRKRPSVNRPTQ